MMPFLSRSIFLFLCAITSFASSAEKPNILLICIDDLRPELACYGVDYIHSPHIDAVAAKGRIFSRHYVQAPTCGASRYTLLTGRYSTSGGNGALFQRAGQLKKNPGSVPPSMPAFFRSHGYTTVSVGKVSHHPGGRGGKDWDQEDQPEMPNSWDRHLLPAGDWQHPRGWMHGLAHGEIRANAKDMDVYQAEKGPDNIYPDGISTDEALRQLGLLTEAAKPFFLAVGILRPHLPFGAPAEHLKPYKGVTLPPTPHPSKPEGKTTWHGSGEFMKYNRWGRNPNTDAEFAMEVRRHYAACVTYADAQVGRVMAKLKESGAADNTIVVIWGDHGWHLGEHAIWGKHALFEESLRSPLIISHPGMTAPGETSRGVVETLDVFPTLCELTGHTIPETSQGSSLLPQLKDPNVAGHSAVSYAGSNRTIRTDRYRLILHRKGEIELYDHQSAELETRNLAEGHPELATELINQLQKKLGE